ncbi:MAG: histidine--tRNA ligase [Patescibacteria group bacterium]
MNDENTKKSLGTEPYKGVRDFYPEDMFIQNHIFSTMRKAVESFGYEEYAASILEPTELYKAKSGEEIVNEQTYSFKDRGDRDVTLRPEMTPTVTRMVAAKRKELSFPLRWYSIPNLFRYEKPQRGRLREHYQLNVDLFGISGINAEVEIISTAHAVMKHFGAEERDFKISINNRKILNFILHDAFNLKEEDAYRITKLIDKKKKISADEFKNQIQEILNDQTDNFVLALNAQNIDELQKRLADKTSQEINGFAETKELLEKLSSAGITNAVFDPTLARGFDYYTGIVFEVNDTDPANVRSLFGGGRFDELLAVFDVEKVPAVGFGMGDVTIRDFLETHNLLPQFSSKTQIALCPFDESSLAYTSNLAQTLRSKGINAVVDITGRKVGDQIKWADKHAIPFIMVIGENEIKDKKFTVKELATKTEASFANEQEIIDYLKRT